jgi:hypothetical protein
MKIFRTCGKSDRTNSTENTKLKGTKWREDIQINGKITSGKFGPEQVTRIKPCRW